MKLQKKLRVWVVRRFQRCDKARLQEGLSR